MKVFFVLALVAATTALPEPVHLPLAAIPEVAYGNEAVNFVNSPVAPVETVKFVDSPAEPAREAILVAELPAEQTAQESVQVADAPLDSFEPISGSELETLRVEGPIDLLAPINFDLQRIDELLRSSPQINFVDIAPLLIPQDIQIRQALQFIKSPDFIAQADAGIEIVQVVDAPIEGQVEKVHFVDAPLEQLAEKVHFVDAPLEQVAEKVHFVDAPLKQVAEKVIVVDAPLEQVAEKVIVVDAPLEQVAEKVIVVDAPLEPISRSELETIRVEVSPSYVQPSETVVVVDDAVPVNFPHRYPTKYYDDPMLR